MIKKYKGLTFQQMRLMNRIILRGISNSKRVASYEDLNRIDIEVLGRLGSLSGAYNKVNEYISQWYLNLSLETTKGGDKT